jgi:hypothetical protein
MNIKTGNGRTLEDREPHHRLSSILAAKRDLLQSAAHCWAFNPCEDARHELEEAAVAFSGALEDMAMHNLRARR